MRWFSKGLDCKVKEMDFRLHELEIRPFRELKEIKEETVTETILELQKSEERLGEKLIDSQQKLYHLVANLEKRIKTLEANDHFRKTGKGANK